MLDTLHDTAPGDPHLYQRAETLAAHLGVNVRTLRKMRSRGDVESVSNAGRVYFRLVEANDRPDPAGRGAEGQGRADLSSQLADVTRALAEARREQAAVVERLHDALTAARVEAERAAGAEREAALLAEVATRDAERAQEDAAHLRAALAIERRRREAAERYSLTPWWRVRERSQLRAQVAGAERLGLPAAVA